MTIEEKTVDPAMRDQKTAEKRQRVPDELWENCKGQCGADTWCRECIREKERLHEERLNRQGRSDDNKD